MTSEAREYPSRPWVGVGVVVWRGDQVLLIKRGRAPRQGEWSIPGGAQGVGETVAEAAVREVAEETGIGIRVDGVISVEDAITRDETGAVRYHYTLVELVATWLSGEVMAGDDATAAAWVGLEEAEARLPHEKTRAVVRQAAERHRGLKDLNSDLER